MKRKSHSLTGQDGSGEKQQTKVDRTRNYDSRLCDKCNKSRLRTLMRRYHGATLSELRTSSEGGCRYCAIFLSAVNKVVPQQLLANTNGEDGCISWDPYQPMHWLVGEESYPIDIFTTLDGPGVTAAENLPGWATPWGNVIDQRAILPDNTFNDASFKQVQTWLQTCTQNHRDCHATAAGNLNLLDLLIPTRLVQISGSLNNLTVRLVESHPKTEEYLCLSHRWGQKDPSCRTLKTNLESHKKTIPWSSLSPVFQDAIYFTSRLGFANLWIDSLCIVQDDKLDWYQESKKMAGIYQNAVLTLAATDATAEGDRLKRECPPETRGIEIENDNRSQQARVKGIYVRQPPRHDVEHAPLLSRAWVYQERLLSRRILHFLPEELLWECNTTISCQCSPSGGVFDRMAPCSSSWNHRYFKQEYTQLLLRTNDFSSTLFSAIWMRIIHAYSNLDLTFYHDRLAALGGIAKQLQLHLHLRFPGISSRYLAGLWQMEFLSMIGWRANDGAYRKSRPYLSPSASGDRWVAPTWSWASISGGVNFAHLLDCDLNSYRMTFVDSHCTSSATTTTTTLASEGGGGGGGGDETLSTDHGASVTLRGPILKARLIFGVAARHRLLLGTEVEAEVPVQYRLHLAGGPWVDFHPDYDFSCSTSSSLHSSASCSSSDDDDDDDEDENLERKKYEYYYIASGSEVTVFEIGEIDVLGDPTGILCLVLRNLPSSPSPSPSSTSILGSGSGSGSSTTPTMASTVNAGGYQAKEGHRYERIGLVSLDYGVCSPTLLDAREIREVTIF